MKTFGENLKYYRKINNINQKEFAKHPTSFINWFEPIICKELEGDHNSEIKFEKFEYFINSASIGTCKTNLSNPLLTEGC